MYKETQYKDVYWNAIEETLEEVMSEYKGFEIFKIFPVLSHDGKEGYRLILIKQ